MLLVYYPIAPLPRSPSLFPYTTLFRSGLTFVCGDVRDYLETAPAFDVAILSHVLEHIDEPERFLGSIKGRFRRIYRSEEHTSELQSRGHLVCRLLLEKKNHNISASLPN